MASSSSSSISTTTTTGNGDFHVVFIPFMAASHMIPMLDIARLFSDEGIRTTIITTPKNADRFIHATSRPLINLKLLPFPSLQAGLPDQCETITDASTPEMVFRFHHAIDMLRPQIETFLREIKPNCIFSDLFFPWTSQFANKLGIPRLFFTGGGFFNQSLSHAIQHFKPQANVESDQATFLVPNLPHRISLTRSQLIDTEKYMTKISRFVDQLKESEKTSFGMVVNSFQELEPSYGDYYRNAFGIKAWHVGPVSLYKTAPPPTPSENYDCLSWLDGRNQNSVAYICYGSVTRLSKTQIHEIAAALEDSTHSFIWVLPKTLKTEEEEEWWLPEGFDDRAKEKGKGIVIKGWAPQVQILEHAAIGGFLTHCGWNSIMEGVIAGVPFITWPTTADQFYNEKLLTQVLKVGIPVGTQEWKLWAAEERSLIDRDKIRKAVDKVMDGGDEEALEMRKMMAKLSESAKEAVKEQGSSSKEFKALIQDIKSFIP